MLRDARLLTSRWGKRILAAEREGSFSTNLRREAGQWTTCACGDHAPLIPVNDSGRPLDPELQSLGVEFSTNVDMDQFLQAAQTLVTIEARAFKVVALQLQIHQQPTTQEDSRRQ